MKKSVVILFILMLISTPTLGQIELYSTLNVGLNYNPTLKMVGTSNDRSSYCDEYINPNYSLLPGCVNEDRGAQDGYTVDFDGAFGRSGSLGLGIQLSPFFAFELEHHFSVASYNETASVNGVESTGADREKLEGEIYKAEERLGDLKSSSFYGRVVFKTSRVGSVLSPYFGVGAGFSGLHAEYASVWARNYEPERINTEAINGLDNADEVKANLAGAVSSAFGAIKDHTFSFKTFGGLEYRLTQRASITFQINYTNYGKLESEDLIWDPLRSHPPNLRLDASEPVQSFTEFNNIYSLNLDFGLKMTL